MKKLKKYISIVSNDLFILFFLTYLFLFMVETLETGFVSFFFNLDIMLWIILLSGTISIFTNSQKKENNLLSLRSWHYFFVSTTGKTNRKNQWDVLFKQHRAQNILDQNLRYLYKDLLLNLREQESRYLSHKLSFLLREISFKRLLDQDWNYFSKNIHYKKQITKLNILLIFVISLFGGIFIQLTFNSIHYLNLSITLLATLIIFLISYLIVSN